MTEDYPYIPLWGRRLGSNHYYIQDQLARARKANAPADALYERANAQGRTGEWARFADLPENSPFRQQAEAAGLTKGAAR